MIGNRKKKSKLTDLDWFVYTLLLKETLGTDKSLSEEEICEACQAVGFNVEARQRKDGRKEKCRWLFDVQDRINESSIPDKIMDHKAYRFYLCTEEQAQVLVELFERKIKHAYTRKNSIKKKMKRNRQGKLPFVSEAICGQMKQAEDFYETYNQYKTEKANG